MAEGQNNPHTSAPTSAQSSGGAEQPHQPSAPDIPTRPTVGTKPPPPEQEGPTCTKKRLALSETDEKRLAAVKSQYHTEQWKGLLSQEELDRVNNAELRIYQTLLDEKFAKGRKLTESLDDLVNGVKQGARYNALPLLVCIVAILRQEEGQDDSAINLGEILRAQAQDGSLYSQMYASMQAFCLQEQRRLAVINDEEPPAKVNVSAFKLTGPHSTERRLDLPDKLAERLRLPPRAGSKTFEEFLYAASERPKPAKGRFAVLILIAAWAFLLLAPWLEDYCAPPPSQEDELIHEQEPNLPDDRFPLGTPIASTPWSAQIALQYSHEPDVVHTRVWWDLNFRHAFSIHDPVEPGNAVMTWPSNFIINNNSIIWDAINFPWLFAPSVGSIKRENSCINLVDSNLDRIVNQSIAFGQGDSGAPLLHQTDRTCELFVPLKNKLTSESYQYKNSWCHYLQLTRVAAERADGLGRQLIELGILEDTRHEAVAELCGDSTTFISDGTGGQSGCTLKPFGGGPPRDEEVVKKCASQYIGDYITKLEQFVEAYNIHNSSKDGDDLAVLSLRDDLLIATATRIKEPCANRDVCNDRYCACDPLQHANDTHQCSTPCIQCGDGQCNGQCDNGKTCASRAGGCGSCCSSSAEWKPTLISTQATSGSLATTLTVELRDHPGDGSGVDLRVCKVSGTFFNDVAVTFEEWVKYSGTTLLNSPLSSSGSTCSPWSPLSGTDAWQEGQSLGGEVRVVSPASCASKWDFHCQSPPSPDCGTCWFFNTSTLQRTCL